ncbi:TANA protein, partial [Penelope pileata]|nr:TANA protein [Penelope pileata]
QMWDLNRRLEAYLARVKSLEEENEGLKAELRNAKEQPGEGERRAGYEQELRGLRAELLRAHGERWAAELGRASLEREVREVTGRWRREQRAREEAGRELSRSQKELQEERRMQLRLEERALQLGMEAEELQRGHRQQKAGLRREAAASKRSPEGVRRAPVVVEPGEVEDYSRQLSEMWRGAVETYREEVRRLEGSLGRAEESLRRAAEDNEQSRRLLRELGTELRGLRGTKAGLELSLGRRWQQQRGEADEFQVG